MCLRKVHKTVPKKGQIPTAVAKMAEQMDIGGCDDTTSET